MLDPEIELFFKTRKDDWLKKNVKASMSEVEINEQHAECEKVFSLEQWLPNAAKRAGQITISTHPCTFSHPSARKNKNGYVSSVIANKLMSADGFLKTGNVQVATDALGNAAALDVYKFLTLTVEDGKNLLDHISHETALSKKLLSIKSEDYTALREGFLAMVAPAGEATTSSKIKQVYFPVNDDYHQLSILTNSGLVFEMRKRLDQMRFSDEIKELRAKKRNQEYSEQGFSEIYNLTTIGYGGTKPQNISVLNNQNGGKAHLLLSMPPQLVKRDIHFPKSDFFKECLPVYQFKESFQGLHKLLKTEHNNVHIRDGLDRRWQHIVDQIIEKMWAIRAVASEQYRAEDPRLEPLQKIWLTDQHIDTRENTDKWLDSLLKQITRWIINSYKKSLGQKSIMLSDKELLKVLSVVQQSKEELR